MWMTLSEFTPHSPPLVGWWPFTISFYALYLQRGSEDEMMRQKVKSLMRWHVFFSLSSPGRPCALIDTDISITCEMWDVQELYDLTSNEESHVAKYWVFSLLFCCKISKQLQLLRKENKVFLFLKFQ